LVLGSELAGKLQCANASTAPGPSSKDFSIPYEYLQNNGFISHRNEVFEAWYRSRFHNNTIPALMHQPKQRQHDTVNLDSSSLSSLMQVLKESCFTGQ